MIDTRVERWQGYIRKDQIAWLARLRKPPGDGQGRTKALQNVGFQSEVVRLALDVVMRNPELLYLVQLRQERKAAEEIAADLGRQTKPSALDLALIESVNELPEPEREVVRLHSGLADGRCWTFNEIGPHMGVTRQRAFQIWQRGRALLMRASAGLHLDVSGPNHAKWNGAGFKKREDEPDEDESELESLPDEALGELEPEPSI